MNSKKRKSKSGGSMTNACVTVSEAAKIKNVTRQAIYLAIRLKRLKAYRHEDQWKVFLSDLDEYDSHLYSRSMHSSEPIFDEANGLISVDKAAKLIAVPKQKLYYAIRTNMLKAMRKRAAWVIKMADLLEYQSHLIKKDYTARRAS